MEGILYVTDEQNRKKYIQIDLEKYGQIVEDILDSITIESRKKEKSYPIEEVLSELKDKGNLDKYV
jgi:exoribonuclease R